MLSFYLSTIHSVQIFLKIKNKRGRENFRSENKNYSSVYPTGNHIKVNCPSKEGEIF